MLFGILLTVQIIVCLAMGGLILIQRSEGGALGMGGGPSGFMSARGAGNLLTTLTGWLAFVFFANSIGLTIAGNMSQKVTSAVDAVDMSKIAAPTAPLTGAATSAAASTSSAPSLSDLPLAGNLPLAPASQAPVQPVPAQALHSASTAPAPVLKMPATSTSSSVTQKQIDAAKANIFKTPSSSAAAPSSSASSAKTSTATPSSTSSASQ